MDKNDKNFNSAQRRHDNMIPDSENYIPCENCEGLGNVFDEYDKEYIKCPICSGLGEVCLSESDLNKLRKEKQDQREIEDFEDDNFFDGTSWRDKYL